MYAIVWDAFYNLLISLSIFQMVAIQIKWVPYWTSCHIVLDCVKFCLLVWVQHLHQSCRVEKICSLYFWHLISANFEIFCDKLLSENFLSLNHWNSYHIFVYEFAVLSMHCFCVVSSLEVNFLQQITVSAYQQKRNLSNYHAIKDSLLLIPLMYSKKFCWNFLCSEELWK